MGINVCMQTSCQTLEVFCVSLDAAQVMVGEAGKLRQVRSHQLWGFAEGVIPKVSPSRLVFQGFRWCKVT